MVNSSFPVSEKKSFPCEEDFSLPFSVISPKTHEGYYGASEVFLKLPPSPPVQPQ